MGPPRAGTSPLPPTPLLLSNLEIRRERTFGMRVSEACWGGWGGLSHVRNQTLLSGSRLAAPPKASGVGLSWRRDRALLDRPARTRGFTVARGDRQTSGLRMQNIDQLLLS